MSADGKLETQLAGGVLLIDVSDQLPRARPYPRRRDKIDRLIIHHSGALGPAGRAGIEASARYASTPKPAGRGFAGFSYTFWLPYHAPKTGPLVIYRGNPDEVRSAHTTGFNDRGVAAVLQGNLTHGHPSMVQLELLEAFLPWAIERYKLELPDGIVWHSLVGKKRACPGAAAVAWIDDYRHNR